MYCYKLLPHLPILPAFLQTQAMTTVGNDVTLNATRPEYASRMLTKNGKTFLSTRSNRADLSTEFKQWIKQNIVSEFTECSISRTSAELSAYQGPHTDKTREFVLMYVLQPGGAECRTVWYQEKGQPFYRPGRQWLMVNDFDQLDVVEQVQLPVNAWSIINTQYLHGVENITEDRISIHIGLDSDDFIKEPK
jgi:hypothetical protein